MKKVIALSTVLVFGALGMVCDGGTAPNANNSNVKPVNTSTPAPIATLAPATNGNSNGGSTTAPTNGNTNGAKMNSNTDTKKP